MPAKTLKVSLEASGVHSRVQSVMVSSTPYSLKAGCWEQLLGGEQGRGGAGQKLHSEDPGLDGPGATHGSAGGHVLSSTSSNQRDLTVAVLSHFPVPCI